MSRWAPGAPLCRNGRTSFGSHAAQYQQLKWIDGSSVRRTGALLVAEATGGRSCVRGTMRERVQDPPGPEPGQDESRLGASVSIATPQIGQ